MLCYGKRRCPTWVSWELEVHRLCSVRIVHGFAHETPAKRGLANERDSQEKTRVQRCDWVYREQMGEGEETEDGDSGLNKTSWEAVRGHRIQGSADSKGIKCREPTTACANLNTSKQEGARQLRETSKLVLTPMAQSLPRPAGLAAPKPRMMDQA